MGVFSDLQCFVTKQIQLCSTAHAPPLSSISTYTLLSVEPPTVPVPDYPRVSWARYSHDTAP